MFKAQSPILEALGTRGLLWIHDTCCGSLSSINTLVSFNVSFASGAQLLLISQPQTARKPAASPSRRASSERTGCRKWPNCVTARWSRRGATLDPHRPPTLHNPHRAPLLTWQVPSRCDSTRLCRLWTRHAGSSSLSDGAVLWVCTSHSASLPCSTAPRRGSGMLRHTGHQLGYLSLLQPLFPPRPFKATTKSAGIFHRKWRRPAPSPPSSKILISDFSILQVTDVHKEIKR